MARLGTAAHAQTRHQKQVMTEQQQKLDMTVAGPQAVNGDRGTGIAAKFDWQSFLAGTVNLTIERLRDVAEVGRRAG
ncbi:MAG: hypothetical protein ACRYHQ_23345 [Janthinobacterium lividum]